MEDEITGGLAHISCGRLEPVEQMIRPIDNTYRPEFLRAPSPDLPKSKYRWSHLPPHGHWLSLGRCQTILSWPCGC